MRVYASVKESERRMRGAILCICVYQEECLSNRCILAIGSNITTSGAALPCVIPSLASDRNRLHEFHRGWPVNSHLSWRVIRIHHLQVETDSQYLFHIQSIGPSTTNPVHARVYVSVCGSSTNFSQGACGTGKTQNLDRSNLLHCHNLQVSYSNGY